MPPITIPEPSKIGGHRDGCSCIACERVRARLLKSPYVQTLRQTIADLITSPAGKPAPQVAELEARVIALTTRNQELENGNELLRQTIQAGEKTTGNLRATILDRDREIKRLTDLQSLTADELGAAQEEVRSLEADALRLDERIGEEEGWRERFNNELTEILINCGYEEVSPDDEGISTPRIVGEALRPLTDIRLILGGDPDRPASEMVAEVRALKTEFTLSGQRIEELENLRAETYNSLQNATNQLQTKTYELACLKADLERRLPVWAQILGGLVVAAIVAAIAHRAGFEAGQGWTK